MEPPLQPGERLTLQFEADWLRILLDADRRAMRPRLKHPPDEPPVYEERHLPPESDDEDGA
jgi:hypothetical protein